MTRLHVALAMIGSLIFSANAHAQITMGMVGDSLTDDYLGGPARANNNLAAYSWGQVLAATRPADFNFGAYKPVGQTWDNNIRYSGYQNNWASSGGVASNNTKVNVVGFGQLSVTVFGASYLSSQTAGLAQQITSGEISTVFASIGSNDFFYRTTLFDMNGGFNPNPDAIIDDAFINDISGSILSNIDTLKNAGTSSGHPVDLVLGLIPAGTAGGSTSDILTGINAVNQLLIQGAATRSIPTLDLFGWRSDKTRVDKNGAVHIGHLIIAPDSSASATDIDPAGTGPCNTNGCALPSHANHFRAEDGLHPNTIIQAFIANQVIATLNSAYGHTIAPITDAEILNLVGVPLPLACQDDADNDGLGSGSYTFAAISCPANTVQIPLVTNTERLGATLQSDNCPYASNADQQDTNTDGVGDLCQGDRDSDGIIDASDNCLTNPNNNQLDTDNDNSGDACDNDDDDDGITDDTDTFPLDASETTDTDSDGIGNNADNCPFTANADQLDGDSDNLGNVCDSFPQDNLLLLQKNGDAAREHFSAGVAIADMNNDGVADILVGSPEANVSSNKKILAKAGVIRIVSGADNSVFRTLNGVARRQFFGTSFVVIDDQNSDSIADVIVGEPGYLKGTGRVALYSGSDGALLQILAIGNRVGDHFGAALALGDVNKDMVKDLIVGAPGSDVFAKNAGQVTAFSGLGNNILYQRSGTQAGQNFGAALALDDDHLFVGSPLYDKASAANSGLVTIFNNNDGISTALLPVEGTAAGDQFGSALSAANSDLNADGEMDWVAGAPLSNNAGKDAGQILLFSGMNSVPAKVLDGSHAGDNFGSAVNLQGDLNRDDKNDLVSSAVKQDATVVVGLKTVLLKDSGQVQVLSGATLFD